jgi:beta-lactam-binding protein with PASTA domain
MSPIPDLLGVPLNTAVATITQQGFTIARIVDSHGNDLDASQLPAEVQPLPVLGQWPLPGTPAAANAGIFVQSSARADYIQKVPTPDLSGLTLDAAKAVLSANNLVLGTTTDVTT